MSLCLCYSIAWWALHHVFYGEENYAVHQLLPGHASVSLVLSPFASAVAVTCTLSPVVIEGGQGLGNVSLVLSLLYQLWHVLCHLWLLKGARDLGMWVLFCHFCVSCHCHTYLSSVAVEGGQGHGDVCSSVTFSLTSVLTHWLLKETGDTRACALVCHFCTRYHSVIYCCWRELGTWEYEFCSVTFCISYHSVLVDSPWCWCNCCGWQGIKIQVLSMLVEGGRRTCSSHVYNVCFFRSFLALRS